MWETTDPDGRTVVLRWPQWNHIRRKHDDLEITPEGVLRVVHDPDERLPGREVGEEWFYRHGAGPSAWVKVVVHYEHDRGRVVTAFPRRFLP